MKKNVLLRIDEKLWKELRNWAKFEIRSLNNLLEIILAKSLKQREEEKNGK